MNDDLQSFLLAAGIGAVAGMRSMTAPSIAADVLSDHPAQAPSEGWLSPFASSRVALALKTASVGEMVVDKLPGVPNRTDPPALLGRMVMGGVSAAALAHLAGGSRLLAAVTGGAAAIGSAYASYEARKRLGEATGWPDAVFALAEDALVVSCRSQLKRAFDELATRGRR